MRASTPPGALEIALPTCALPRRPPRRRHPLPRRIHPASVRTGPGPARSDRPQTPSHAPSPAFPKISGAPVRSFVWHLALTGSAVKMTGVAPVRSRCTCAGSPALSRSRDGRPGSARRMPSGLATRDPSPRQRDPDTWTAGVDPHIGPRGENPSSSWNFCAASLYNAAMLRPAASLRPPAFARARSLALAGLFSSMALSSTAHAQPPASPPAPSPAAGKAATTTRSTPPRTRGGNKVIALDDEFLVEGRLEKPSAFYVLRRSATDYDWARLDAVFTPLVLESVQDPLF